MIRNPDRYKTILRIRKQAEDRQALLVAAVRREIVLAERQRDSLETTRRAALDSADTSLQTQFDAGGIRSYYQYERHLAGLRDEKDAEIRALQTRQTEQLALLERATVGRRVAEKLDEHRRAAYQETLRKEEQTRLDEVATMYAARSAATSEAAIDRGSESC